MSSPRQPWDSFSASESEPLMVRSIGLLAVVWQPFRNGLGRNVGGAVGASLHNGIDCGLGLDISLARAVQFASVYKCLDSVVNLVLSWT